MQSKKSRVGTHYAWQVHRCILVQLVKVNLEELARLGQAQGVKSVPTTYPHSDFPILNIVNLMFRFNKQRALHALQMTTGSIIQHSRES